MRASFLSFLGLGFGLFALVACDATPPAAAGGPAFLAQNGRTVFPLKTPGQFEVLAQSGDVGRDLFCAAGDFADRRLGARSTDRVILISAIGPSQIQSGRRGAVFTTASQSAVQTSSGLLIRARRVGETVSVGHARHLCRQSENAHPFS